MAELKKVLPKDVAVLNAIVYRITGEPSGSTQWFYDAEEMRFICEPESKPGRKLMVAESCFKEWSGL